MNKDYKIMNLATLESDLIGIIVDVALESETKECYFWDYKSNLVSKYHKNEICKLEEMSKDLYVDIMSRVLYLNINEPKFPFSELNSSVQRQLEEAREEQAKNFAISNQSSSLFSKVYSALRSISLP